MKDVKRCTRCILPADFPHITFDEKGVCNYCLEWDKRWKNFDYEKAERELIKIFSEVKKKNRKYDCMVPFSGGRDSTYVLYLVKRKYGLNPLAVTFNNGFLSEYAVENILNAIKILNVDHVMHSYNWGILKKMYKTTVQKSGEFCSICTNGINYTKITYQEKFDIPLLISGTSGRVDEQSPFEIISSNPKYVRKVLKDNFSDEEINNFILPRWSELNTFELIKKKIAGKGYISINLPDYIKWDMNEIINVLMNELKWKTPDREKDHIDCKFASIKTYLKNQQIPGFIFKQEKFSQLIRDGQMTREEALNKLDKLISEEKEPAELDDFMKILDLKKDDIEAVKNKSHLKYISREELKSKESLTYQVLSIPWKMYKFIAGKN